MISVFLDAVLPIAALIGVGYAFARFNLFDSTMATGVNRFVFMIAVPALLLRLISGVDFAEFEWRLLFGYLFVEIIVYASGFAVARLIYRRPPLESLMIGMAATFPNHVFFGLPIATALYGENAAFPIVAIITVDAVLIHSGTLLILDAVSGRAGGASFSGVLRKMALNPQIVAIGLGVAVALLSVDLPKGFDVFLAFTGNAAAPAALFALGVIVSSQPPPQRPSVGIVISAMKLGLHPLLVWLVVVELLNVTPTWADPALLVAAGPAGAMPFVLSLQYGVPVRIIARVIIWTTIAALGTVTLVASL
jgi:predicted permease